MSASTIVKRSGFDPNQPRDEDGKWTDGSSTGSRRSYDDRNLTQAEKDAQPDFLKGTSWVPVSVDSAGVEEVFTPEVIRELWGDKAFSEDLQENVAEALVRSIGRARRTGGQMFVDRERQVVAVVDGDALSVDKYKAEVQNYLDLWEPVGDPPPANEVALAELAATRVQRGIEWFDDPWHNPDASADEVAGQRIHRMLTTVQGLQDVADVGPIIVRVTTPMSTVFDRRISGGADKDEPSSAVGQATRMTTPSWFTSRFSTIDMNTLAHYGHDQGPTLRSDWSVQPYYHNPQSAEQDTQSPYLGTLIHEWGHQVAFKRERESRDYVEQAVAAWDSARAGQGSVTRYGLTNVNEFQAEAFTAWFTDRSKIEPSGHYSDFARWADDNLDISGFAGSRIDDVEFITVDGLRVPVAKANRLVAIGCTMNPNEGSLYVYDDGSTEVVNELFDVEKHLAGTDADHDQSTHAGSGEGQPDASGGGSEPNVTQMKGEDFAAWAESMGINAINARDVAVS